VKKHKLKKSKVGKIKCEVPGCSCNGATTEYKAEVRALIKTPWNPPDADAARASRAVRGALPGARRPAPGDRSAPVAIAPDVTPYASMGRFTSKQIKKADREWSAFLRLRLRNAIKNVGKHEESSNE
jgi:hypothetical protein